MRRVRPWRVMVGVIGVAFFSYVAGAVPGIQWVAVAGVGLSGALLYSGVPGW